MTQGMKNTPYQYEVRKKGRPHAVFVYARDAQKYVESDVARDFINVPESHPRRNANGQSAVYSIEDYTIHDLTADGRRVVGVSGHGWAILEKMTRV